MQPKRLYWLNIIILQLLLLVIKTQFTHGSDVIRVGGLFDASDPYLGIAFRQAVNEVNKDGDLMPDTQLSAKIANIPNNDSFRASRKACSVIKRGVGAIFGPQSPGTSAAVESICEALEIPHIKTTPGSSLTGDTYSVNLFPRASTLGKAYSEVLKYLEWTKFCIIYENNDGLVRLQEIMKDTHFDVTLKQLPSGDDDYRSPFKEAREDGIRNIVLDVSLENIHTVLKQAQQVGMVTDYHSYFITSLDLATIDVEEFSHGGANMLSLQLVDSQDPKVQQVLRDLRNETSNNIKAIQTEVALMYDAVKIFSKAIDGLSRSVNIDTTPLDCDGDATWGNGVALNNYIKMVQINGLTGLIQFDANGFRSDVALAVVELTKDGFRKIGSWDQTSGVNSTRTDVDIQEVIKENLQDKTLIVSIALNEPYVMLSERSEPLSGNDRYEGFCIDLISEISKRLGFNFTLVRTTGDRYGYLNPETNQWTGLIGDLLDLKADLAITDLTITSAREEAVDFTNPFMNTGISILYVKPKWKSPGMFIFMFPFSIDLWIYLALAYLGVSLIIYALARLSPFEQVADLSSLEEKHKKMGNQFSWDNSMWFAIGSLLQQQTYQQPRAASTRIVALAWWFFVLMMICSYTASLVTIFSAGLYREESPIGDVYDLAQQTKIRYGTYGHGSTHNFFRKSKFSIYKKIYAQMENVKNVEEGMKRVEQDSGHYAMFMESSTIDYIAERRCDLQQVGGLLDSKAYGIALPPGSPYRELINSAIVSLQEDDILNQLKKRWWYEMRGGGMCKRYIERSNKYPQSVQLGIRNVSGLFIILLIGVSLATVIAIAEFLWKKWKQRTQK